MNPQAGKREKKLAGRVLNVSIKTGSYVKFFDTVPLNIRLEGLNESERADASFRDSCLMKTRGLNGFKVLKKPKHLRENNRKIT